MSHDLRETARFVEREPTSRTRFAALRGAPARVTSRILTNLSLVVRDSAALHARVDGSASAWLRDTGAIRSLLSGSKVFVLRTREVATLNDRVWGRSWLRVDVVDHVAGTSRAEARATPAALRDRASLASRVDAVQTWRPTLRESGRLTDRLSAPLRVDLRDTVWGTARLTARQTQRGGLRDQAWITARLTTVGTWRGDLRASARGLDRLTTLMTQRTVLRDRATLSSRVLGVAPGAVIWVALLKTMAMTQYRDLPITTLAGDFAGGPTGVYQPSAGGAVSAELETKLSDLGTPRPKRVRRAFVDAQQQGALELETRTLRYGQVQDVRYTLPAPPTGTAWAIQRVVLARGVKGTHWAFRLSNPTGAPFAVRQLDISEIGEHPI